ncbi:MAG: hypothetical protein B0D96_05295 [Candidatus Sedimenticola endophacoides]|uniref:HDOD domain-containing protein n=1 Tax=Candidatus Sedimenticola endophacoides TaxID=2548426 RepID=A0A657PZP6_9GAMM|nr:MAG: hypothetical protein B0D94_04950 [Candidatus Sedimenticola endophacoides]OQX36005.1 MAG: hypothetical protein B0D96_05295 [Candidatus Sedimenticola endophacoides]OQX41104.1 MAG: hypothetical protein B0D89_05160 [Candidatus Sedimenticola endophacoides]OQX44324.1 MAG: hypothetical protein B0D88_02705 [Candidatus Sedimenticola endophacoides]OQX45603.1 MAG: hypothetical protein B0D86_03380 [Candidatus Sedimenticola endophacoides]
MSIDQQKLERLVDKMPTFPQSVHRIIEICSDINFSTRELISIIEHDPIITLKLLKLVNSAYFGLSRKITSIKHSVVYIGANTIKNVAMTITTIGILPTKAHAGINRNNFLMHSLTTASLAKLIAKEKGVAEAQLTDYFIAGLLHDIGVILAAQLVQDEYRAVLHLTQNCGMTPARGRTAYSRLQPRRDERYPGRALEIPPTSGGIDPQPPQPGADERSLAAGARGLRRQPGEQADRPRRAGKQDIQG